MAEAEGTVEEFEDVPDKVTDTDDGGAIVQVSDDVVPLNREWYENIADDFDDSVLNALCTRPQRTSCVRRSRNFPI